MNRLNQQFAGRSKHSVRFPLRGMLALAGGLLCLGLQAADSLNSIVDSKHNLAISGIGPVRSSLEADICVFCHAPHNGLGQTPLWNRELAQNAYTPYNSSTLKAVVGQPTGSSKLCLSCHDGTMALGMVRNRTTPIPMLKGNTVMPSGKSRFGTDLSAHHPISFVYDSGLATVQRELRDPAVLSKEVKLDHDRQMQCTSCHDPHSDRFGKFLVKDNTASALCLECHVPKDWKNSSHAISAATWKGTGRNPWPNTKFQNVAANGCENCHTPHNAGTKPHLLHYSKPEDNCLVCHNGSVAEKNLLAEFNKVSTHPITGVTSTKDFSAGMMRGMDSNVSCTDCHNPHASGNAAAKSGTLDPALSRVKGMNAGGALVDVSSFEYELCFRCHASSTSVGTRMLPRQFSQPNVRLQFTPGNRSYHPVLAPARAVNDPTLITPWTEAQTLKCSDCHNNDQGPGAKANGPNGPHGSRYAPLLERNLVQVDGQAESPTAYALCYKCHSESILMADRLHGQHVREQKTACTTCHDSHGVQNQTHLINFNTLYARPLNGQLSYTDLGAGLSQCTLTCHGKDHQGSGYNTSQPVRAATARRR